MIRACLAGALVTFTLSASAPAWAGTVNRAFVSGHGVDQPGCGAPSNPCRSLQFTHDHVVGPRGEIDILDPAGYGAINITKSISIVNDGVGTAGVQATTQNAITITAASGDVVLLRGLNIDGVNSADTGIQLNSAGSLSIQDCAIQHFAVTGVNLGPTAGTVNVAISGTTVSDNGGAALLANAGGDATMNLMIDHFTAERDTTGVAVVAAGATNYAVSIVDSLFRANAAIGVSMIATSGHLVAVLDRVNISLNHNIGLNNATAGVVHLSRSVVSQNGGQGIVTTNSPTSTFGVFSTGDNLVVGNGVNLVGVLGVDAPM